MAVEDPFQVLALPVDAAAERIWRRYRELVARHHPDRAATGTPEQRQAAHDRDGVHFRAKDPAAGGGIEPAPGDPDFDHSACAPSELSVSNGPFERGVWSARAAPPRQRWPWR